MSDELVSVAPTLESGEMRLEGDDMPPEELERLVGRCWAQKPSQRPKLNEIIMVLETCLAGLPPGHARQENEIFDAAELVISS